MLGLCSLQPSFWKGSWAAFPPSVMMFKLQMQTTFHKENAWKSEGAWVLGYPERQERDLKDLPRSKGWEVRCVTLTACKLITHPLGAGSLSFPMKM